MYVIVPTVVSNMLSRKRATKTMKTTSLRDRRHALAHSANRDDLASLNQPMTSSVLRGDNYGI